MTLEDIEIQYEILRQTFYVDEHDLLREKCTDMLMLQQIIDLFEEILPSIKDDETKYDIFSKLGNLHRINKNLPQALHYLNESYQYYKDHNEYEKMIIACGRYAEALKYDHRYTEAMEMFDHAFDYYKLYEVHAVEHFIWQHRGKCCMEMGAVAEAESSFIKAYILRKELNDERLLEASHKALNFISKVKR